MALWELQKDQTYEIVALLTTITEGYNRVSMHGVRRILAERQAESLGVPLEKVMIPPNATNEVYEVKMSKVLARYREQGIHTVAFGDLFLEDIKQYREKNLARIAMSGLFPIWKRDTAQLVREFIVLGYKAIVVCIDAKVLDQSYAGKLIDEDFLGRLPPHVDPCGENGEFHSFVFAGPLFREEIRFTVGERVFRDAHWFCDLLPA